MADKKRSLEFLDRYFKDTPDEQILVDMRKFCPELFSGSEVRRERWWPRLWHRIFR